MNQNLQIFGGWGTKIIQNPSTHLPCTPTKPAPHPNQTPVRPPEDRATGRGVARFPGDGTVVFMDFAGGVYRLKLTTGEEIWRCPSTVVEVNRA